LSVVVDHPSSSSLTVPLTVSGTASSADATVGSSVTFAAGATSASVVVTVVDDALYEGPEVLSVSLGTAPGVLAGAITTHTVTIQDNDSHPEVSFADASSFVSESVGTTALSVVLDRPSSSSLTVPLTVSGTASSSDAMVGSSVTFAAGATSASVVVTVVDDALYEGAETLSVSLGASPGVSAGAITTHTLTIQDNDSLPQVSFAVASSSVSESVGTTTLLVVLDHPSSSSITVPLSVSGTASSADASLPTSVTFAAGATSASVVVTVVDDGVYEGAEALSVSLGTSPDASAGAIATHTLTIDDDDAMPAVTWVQPTVSLREDAGQVLLPVQLDHASAHEIAVQVTATGTAANGGDAVAAAAVLFPAGSLATAVSLQIINDQLHENDETLTLTLVPLTGCTVGRIPQEVVTIVDDDPLPSLAWSQAQGRVDEDGGTWSVEAALSAPSQVPVSVQVAISGTATLGQDAQVHPTTLTFAPGETVHAVTVTVQDDSLVEGDESVILTLANPTDATLGATSITTLTIVDQDRRPVIGFRTASSSRMEQVGEYRLDLDLSVPSLVPLTIGVETDGTAAVPADAQVPPSVVIPAETRTATLVVTIVDDTLDEDDERLVIRLLAGAGYELSPQATHQVTIVDNEAPPTVSWSQVSLACREGDAVTTLSINLSAATTRPVSVSVQAEGTATIGQDATSGPLRLTIPAGSTAVTYPITIIDDQEAEDSENLSLTLTDIDHALLGTPARCAVTIADNDLQPLVGFGRASSTVSEAIGTCHIPLTMDRAVPWPVTVTLGGQGTADSGVDYHVPTTIVFPPQATTADLQVTITDDTTVEGGEMAILLLGEIQGGHASTASLHQLTIQDNDQPAALSFATASSTIIESAPQAVVTVTLSTPRSEVLSCPVSVGGTATAGADYGTVPPVVTIPAGQTTVAFAVPILDDALLEGAETIVITLHPTELPADVVLGAVTTHAVVLTDDETSPLTPILEYVQDHGEGRYTAFFGYRNLSQVSVEVPIGSGNHVDPGTADQGQAVRFRIGRTDGWPGCAFSVPFRAEDPADTATWHLLDLTATATTDGPRPPAPVLLPEQPDQPTAQILAPVNGQVHDGAQPLTVLVGATAGTGRLVKVQVLVDGVVAGEQVPLPRSGITIPLDGLAVGTHTITATATDDRGLSATSLPVVIRVGAAPQVTLARLGTGPIPALQALHLAVAPVDADGAVSQVMVALDGTVVSTLAAPP
jgi:hypothetical protein